MAENNRAIVIKVNKTEEIPELDKIHLVKLFGTQVITSKDVKEGDIMIYVDSNMKLSHDFLHYNNLYRHSEYNKDRNKSGYFDDNGRVKTIKMKGVISDGFLFPPEYIYNAFSSDRGKFPIGWDSPGYEFNELGGYKVCEKYIPPQKQTGSGKKSSSGRKYFKVPMFVEHFDTTQFMRNKEKIPPKTVVYIEEKIHGTSQRSGYVNINLYDKLSWIKKFLLKILIGKNFNINKWMHLNGTRRVVNDPDRKRNPYHDPTMREEVFNKLKGQLLKGEQLYMELFGYEKTGKHIQKDFPYGCNPGKYRVLLYRVTMNNEDGKVVDYPREYVYKRAEELGLEKPHLFEKFYYSGTEKSMQSLENRIIEHSQGQSAMSEDTMREGVVVWFINDNGRWEALKYKSDNFRLKESNLKNKGYVDQEDIT